MKRRKWNAPRPMPAADLFDDDLLKAQDFFRKPHRHQKNDRKVQQLCRQVQRAVSFALGGACGDPLLQSLFVDSVVPSPDANRLTVFVCLPEYFAEAPADGDESIPIAVLLERLDRVRPLLRREVAAAITRKRAPELVFQIMQAPEPEVLP